MRRINTAFNIAFARAMAKHNCPEAPEAKSNHFYKTPGSESMGRANISGTRAAYSREIRDRLNEIRSI